MDVILRPIQRLCLDKSEARVESVDYRIFSGEIPDYVAIEINSWDKESYGKVEYALAKEKGVLLNLPLTEKEELDGMGGVTGNHWYLFELVEVLNLSGKERTKRLDELSENDDLMVLEYIGADWSTAYIFYPEILAPIDYLVDWAIAHTDLEEGLPEEIHPSYFENQRSKNKPMDKNIQVSYSGALVVGGKSYSNGQLLRVEPEQNVGESELTKIVEVKTRLTDIKPDDTILHNGQYYVVKGTEGNTIKVLSYAEGALSEFMLTSVPGFPVLITKVSYAGHALTIPTILELNGFMGGEVGKGIALALGARVVDEIFSRQNKTE